MPEQTEKQTKGRAISRDRVATYFDLVFKFLIARGGQVHLQEVREALEKQLDLTPYELQSLASGQTRWWNTLQFWFIGYKTADFLRRGHGIWSITDVGREFHASKTPLEILEEARRRYDEWSKSDDLTPDEETTVEEVTEVDDANPAGRAWLIGTGPGGSQWEQFRRGNFVAISFKAGDQHVGDVSQLRKEQIRAELRQLTGRPNPFNDTLCLWQFGHEMQVGDCVIARSGKQRLLGIGRVRGPYQFRPGDGDYRHRRDVEWIETFEREMPDNLTLPTKTLTEIGGYPYLLDLVIGTRTSAAVTALSSRGHTTEQIEQHFSQRAYPAPTPPTDLPSSDQPPTLDSIDAESFLSRHELEGIVTALRSKRAIVLQGSPGTGKSYLAEKIAHYYAGDRARVLRVQFHPSYAYEDFVRGIRPIETGGFRVENGPLVDIALQARRRPHELFVLLIDEINRANVAKVMGEALSLIEADKRDAKYAVHLGLAWQNGKEFWIPQNVAILATMNTADRSIAMVDYALRRRFAFFTLQPAFDRPDFRAWLMEQFGGSEDELGTEGLTATKEANRAADRVVKTMLQVNRAISEHRALGPHYVIGHSFFCNFEADCGETPLPWVERVFATEIVPLISEYCVEHPKLRSELHEILAGA